MTDSLKLNTSREHFRIFRDHTACAAPVGLFYHDQYHTFGAGARDFQCGGQTRVRNFRYTQHRCPRLEPKCGIVLAFDTEPALLGKAASAWSTVYRRRIDLMNVEQLKTCEAVTVVVTMGKLQAALGERIAVVTGDGVEFQNP